MELAGWRYAVVTHRGPYDVLGQRHQRLDGAWLPRPGHEVRDVPAFEEYLNSPQNTKPEDLLTKVWVPIV
jgi:AraC family transcriptional regulator